MLFEGKTVIGTQQCSQKLTSKCMSLVTYTCINNAMRFDCRCHTVGDTVGHTVGDTVGVHMRFECRS